MIEPTEFRFNNKNRRKGDTKTRIVNAVYKGKNIFIVDQMMNVSNLSLATTAKWESKMYGDFLLTLGQQTAFILISIRLNQFVKNKILQGFWPMLRLVEALNQTTI